MRGILAVTGGTGTFGQAFIPAMLSRHPALVIRVISRDEYKQAQMQRLVSHYSDRVRFFLGDVRDPSRLRLALRDVDYLVHAAALKRIDQSEYNPYEFVQTNVVGTMNVAQAAIDCGVRVAVFLSTDKAVEPANVYGSTKNLAEKAWIQSNSYSPTGTLFCATRYGNILGSRGSVVEVWQRCLHEGTPLPVTDLSATRFAMSIGEAVELVEHAVSLPLRGGIFVPVLHAFRLDALLRTVVAFHGQSIDNGALQTLALHPGEKLHETLMSRSEQQRAVQICDTIWCLPPALAFWGDLTSFTPYPLLSETNPVFTENPYCSDTWPLRTSNLGAYVTCTTPSSSPASMGSPSCTVGIGSA